jgi:hypothetical protein
LVLHYNPQKATSPATSPQRQQHYEQQQQRSAAKQKSVTKLNTLTMSTTAAAATATAADTAAVHTKSTAVAAGAADAQYTDLTKDRGTPRVLKVWGDVQPVELAGTGYVTRQTLQKTDSSSAAQVNLHIYESLYVCICLYALELTRGACHTDG